MGALFLYGPLGNCLDALTSLVCAWAEASPRHLRDLSIHFVSAQEETDDSKIHLWVLSSRGRPIPSGPPARLVGGAAIFASLKHAASSKLEHGWMDLSRPVNTRPDRALTAHLQRNLYPGLWLPLGILDTLFGSA